MDFINELIKNEGNCMKCLSKPSCSNCVICNKLPIFYRTFMKRNFNFQACYNPEVLKVAKKLVDSKMDFL